MKGLSILLAKCIVIILVFIYKPCSWEEEGERCLNSFWHHSPVEVGFTAKNGRKCSGRVLSLLCGGADGDPSGQHLWDRWAANTSDGPITAGRTWKERRRSITCRVDDTVKHCWLLFRRIQRFFHKRPVEKVCQRFHKRLNASNVPRFVCLLAEGIGMIQKQCEFCP